MKRLLLILSAAFFLCAQNTRRDLRFVILGDRSGEPQAGVYEQIWRDTAAEHPDFIINVGDTIQGENDATVDAEWQSILLLLKRYRRYPLYFTAGNHDVWSSKSAEAYQRYTKEPLHYSFDRGPVHLSVLDNSRTEDLPGSELAWLEKDLAAHRTAPLKFVFSHRPSWILNTVLMNPDFPLERIAKKYHVQYVVAGHVHEIMHFDLEGVTYLSVASSGGHLRNSKQYKDGWFFAHTLVTVHDGSADLSIKETGPPFGEGRISSPDDWGAAGLNERSRR